VCRFRLLQLDCLLLKPHPATQNHYGCNLIDDELAIPPVASGSSRISCATTELSRSFHNSSGNPERLRNSPPPLHLTARSPCLPTSTAVADHNLDDLVLANRP